MMREWLPTAVGVVFLVLYPAWFAYAATRAARTGGGDRLALLRRLATAVLGLALGRLLVPWDVVPPVGWALPAAAVGWGTLAAAQAWRSLPLVGSGRRWRRLGGTGIELILAFAVVMLSL